MRRMRRRCGVRRCCSHFWWHGRRQSLLGRDRRRPLDLVTGHSSGMNSAMAVSGALDLESALEFAYRCGLAMDRDCDSQPGGLLALVGAGRETAEAIAAESGASLANHNAADQTVLGGSFEALAAGGGDD